MGNKPMRVQSWFMLVVIVGWASSALAITPSDLSLVRFPDDSTTFAQPIAIRAPHDGSGRVFIIERCNDIRIVANGALLSTPFLSIDAGCTDEQGILGLAFDPDFASNGTFYVAYTAPDGAPALGASNDQILARYTVSAANANVANPDGTIILRVPDIEPSHNGGDIHFDADGYLDWSMGDGGVGGDPHGFAQCTGRKRSDSDPSTCGDISGSGFVYYLLGKIIRLDVHNTTASAPANFCGATPGQAAPYAVPPGNPFADAAAHPNDCAEILNWGFRNPFRFSIAPDATLLIGDVGQNSYEEIDAQPAASAGQNFQWPLCEGFHTYPEEGTPCDGPAGSVAPKLEYAHSENPYGCAVVGGYIYRGPIVALQGQYVFGDYCTGKLYVVANPSASASTWSYEAVSGTPAMHTYGFGEDEAGNLYVADGDGPIYILHSDSVPPPDPIFANGFD